MIISIAPAGPRWVRRAVIVLACAVLTALLASMFDVQAPPPSNVVAQPTMGGLQEIARPPSDDAYRKAPVIPEARHRIADVTGTVVPSTPQLATVPFSFLGLLDVEGVTSVVLYGRGRTLTVQGPGPLDEEYAVDAMEGGYLMLRHLPSGTSHMLELNPRQHMTIPVGPAAETAPD